MLEGGAMRDKEMEQLKTEHRIRCKQRDKAKQYVANVTAKYKEACGKVREVQQKINRRAKELKEERAKERERKQVLRDCGLA